MALPAYGTSAAGICSADVLEAEDLVQKTRQSEKECLWQFVTLGPLLVDTLRGAAEQQQLFHGGAISPRPRLENIFTPLFEPSSALRMPRSPTLNGQLQSLRKPRSSQRSMPMLRSSFSTSAARRLVSGPGVIGRHGKFGAMGLSSTARDFCECCSGRPQWDLHPFWRGLIDPSS